MTHAEYMRRLIAICKPTRRGHCLICKYGPCQLYSDGLLPPRYPVPAIPTRVELGRYHVAVIDNQGFWFAALWTRNGPSYQYVY